MKFISIITDEGQELIINTAHINQVQKSRDKSILVINHSEPIWTMHTFGEIRAALEATEAQETVIYPKCEAMAKRLRAQEEAEGKEIF